VLQWPRPQQPKQDDGLGRAEGGHICQQEVTTGGSHETEKQKKAVNFKRSRFLKVPGVGVGGGAGGGGGGGGGRGGAGARLLKRHYTTIAAK